MGCKALSQRMQKKGAETGKGTRAKFCIILETGHRGEPIMLGSATKRRQSLCWRLLDHLMRRQRWQVKSKLVNEATVRLDLQRNEKEATMKGHHVAVSDGLVTSR